MYKCEQKKKKARRQIEIVYLLWGNSENVEHDDRSCVHISTHIFCYTFLWLCKYEAVCVLFSLLIRFGFWFFRFVWRFSSFLLSRHTHTHTYFMRIMCVFWFSLSTTAEKPCFCLTLWYRLLLYCIWTIATRTTIFSISLFNLFRSSLFFVRSHTPHSYLSIRHCASQFFSRIHILFAHTHTYTDIAILATNSFPYIFLPPSSFFIVYIFRFIIVYYVSVGSHFYLFSLLYFFTYCCACLLFGHEMVMVVLICFGSVVFLLHSCLYFDPLLFLDFERAFARFHICSSFHPHSLSPITIQHNSKLKSLFSFRTVCVSGCTILNDCVF